ncbi:MAG: methyltransferase domain-containing protein [Chloroflexi bacterium]|nr:methyltransferase domain-containing protein [Chloroflexota bacterium]
MTSDSSNDNVRFPPEFFQRADPAPDTQFYREPRFVTHIDDATIEALTGLYAEVIPPGSAVLDLMSSWVSHLPTSVAYERVSGLGMNEQELATNHQLDDYVVHDLNQRPELPYLDESFDFVVSAVSVQYLARPTEVFASIARVLRPGGTSVVAFSHRMFPTKAVAIWQELSRDDRARLVASYHVVAGAFDDPVFVDRSPADADPLWVVVARKRSADGSPIT